MGRRKAKTLVHLVLSLKFHQRAIYFQQLQEQNKEKTTACGKNTCIKPINSFQDDEKHLLMWQSKDR